MHAGQLRSFFASASEYVSECGYQDERKWYSNLRFETVTERQLLCESAWVILCSGFRENTVRRCFGYISWCFLDWISSTEIVGSADRCIGLATLRFRHEGKLRAIVSVAQKVSEVGLENIKTRVSQNPIDTLQEFPYVGRVTAFHLAKNLGLPFAKPDRHMEALRKKTFGDAAPVFKDGRFKGLSDLTK